MSTAEVLEVVSEPSPAVGEPMMSVGWWAPA